MPESNGAGVAWHSNDSELISDQNSRTYDQYRGFAVVTTTVGDATEPGHPQSQTITTYLRGMDQDPDKAAAAAGSCTSGTLTQLADCTPFAFTDDVSGVSTVDDNALAGTIIETQKVDTGSGNVFSTASNVPWKSSPMAAHQRYPVTLPYLRSRELGVAQSFTRATLASGASQVTQVRYWHDTQYGGQVVATDTLAPSVADGSTEVCTVTTFAKPDPNAVPWMIGYANSTTTTAAPCLYATPSYSDPLPAKQSTGPLLAATRSYFDNGTTFPTAVSVGNVTRTEAQTGTSAAPGQWQLQTTAGFDNYGRPLWATNAAGAKTTTAYTPTNPALPSPELPVTVTVTSPDPTTGAPSWTSSTMLDPTRGLPLTATDVNGRVTAVTYDVLGRVTAVWKPGRTTSTAYPPPSTVAPNVKYSYTVNGYLPGSNSSNPPSEVETDTLREDGTYAVSTSLMDSLGRTRQTQTVPLSDDAGRVITDTTYDSSGRVDYVSGPYYDNSSAPSGNLWTVTAQTAIPRQTQTQYDGLGRTVNQIMLGSSKELWRTHTDYVGVDRVDITPPAGGVRTSTVTNTRGETIAQYTYHSGAAFGTVDFGHTDTLNYSYDPLGHLSEVDQVADAAGDKNKWMSAYDLLGRKISAHDPDTGDSTYAYDADGNLQTTTTALNTTDQKSLNYTYDRLNRRTAEYAGTAAMGTPLAQWQYDTVPALSVSQSLTNPGSDTKPNLGRPAGSWRNTDASDHYIESIGGYDAAGNPLSQSLSIPTDGSNATLAGTYTTTNHYTALGQLTSTDLPNGGDLQADTVGYGYDSNGLMAGSTDSYADLVQDSSFTPYGEVMRRVLGDYPNQVVQDTAYDVPTRRVFSSTISQLAWNAPIDATAYTYDPAGHITAAVDVQATGGSAAPGSIVPTTLAIDAQCYHYDYANRLDAAWSDTVPSNSVSQISNTVTNTVFGTTTTPGTAGQSTVTQIPDSAKPTTGALGGCTRVAPTPGVTATWQIGGPQPYAQVFSYDNPTGNRHQEQDYNTSGAVTQTSTYNYNTAGANQPHILNSVNHSTTTPDTYLYDAYGNTKQRAISGSPVQNLSWDAENRLQTDNDGSGAAAGYIYDADGNQLLRRDATTVTLYLGSTELHMNRNTHAITGMRYFSTPGAPTITETGSSTPTLSYEAGNLQNTSSLTIAASPANASQAVTARRAYTPFNTPRGTGQSSIFGTFPDDHTFLGKTTDTTTNLVDIGARKYDPTTGRFISIDPVFQPSNPQAISGYAYAGNDPVNGSDPSGLITSMTGGGCDPNDTTCPGSSGGNSNSTTVPPVPQATSTNNAPVSYSNSAPTTPPPVQNAEDPKKYKGHADFWDLLPFALAGGVIVGGAVAGAIAAAPEIGEGATATCVRFFGVCSKAIAAAIFGAGIVNGANGGDEPPVLPQKGGKGWIGRLVRAGGEACESNSFVATTPVLMADGKTKPIADVKVGDQIADSIPGGSNLEQHRVTAIHITDNDIDYTTLTIKSGHSGGKITGTSHHIFYSLTEHAWVPAGELRPGDKLQTPDGSEAVVTAVRNFTQTARTYNLTVDGLHTYYVVAGDTPVLVHNCDPLALGWQDDGFTKLDDFAKNNGFHTLSNTPADGFAMAARKAIIDPSVNIVVKIPNSPKWGSFLQQAQQGLMNGEGGHATALEMSYLARALKNGQRTWSSISWYGPDGKLITDMKEPDLSGLKGDMSPLRGGVLPYCDCNG